MRKIDNNAEVIIETDNLVTTQLACSDAMINKDMIAVIGPAGSGKTTGFKDFQKKHPEHVFIVNARKSMSARQFYSSIANSIADESYDSHIPLFFCINKAANVFIEDSSNKLLIIDEAGKFSPQMLEYLHEFRDLTKETTGIILGGVDYFQKHLVQWNEKNKQGMPEVYSRISSWHQLSKPLYQEVIAIIQAHGIKDAVFERSCKGIENFRILKNKIGLYKKLPDTEK